MNIKGGPDNHSHLGCLYLLGSMRLLALGCSVTRLGERTWETLSPSQHGGGTNNYTGFAKGTGVSLSIKNRKLDQELGAA